MLRAFDVKTGTRLWEIKKEHKVKLKYIFCFARLDLLVEFRDIFGDIPKIKANAQPRNKKL